VSKANLEKSCVRFKRLADPDEKALRELIRTAPHLVWDVTTTMGVRG